MAIRPLVVSALLLCFASCGKSVSKQVRTSICNLDHMQLSTEQVEVGEIRQIGDHVVAEVTIKTAVKASKKNGRWTLEEVRIGDRRWEKIEHILAALDQQRIETSLQQLELLSRSIHRYTDLKGQAPQVDRFDALLDILSPQYLGQIIRIDAWSNPFYYRNLSARNYDLRSAGPDGRIGTSDDLVPTRP